MSGKLYFRYAAMSAGKSTMLLQAAYNYEERGMGVVLYTAGVDDREGQGFIASRLGLKREALTFDASTQFDVDKLLTPDGSICACFLIDEGQFLSKDQAQQLHRLAHNANIPIMVYGLRSDFLGQPFEGSAALLTLADHIEEVRTICRCGKKASMNARVDEKGNRVFEGAQVEIGGNARYQSLCPKCFYRKNPNSKESICQS